MGSHVMRDIAEKRIEYFQVKLDKVIIEDGFNVRDDYGDMDELAMNIAQNGQKQPGIARLSDDKTSVTLIDGHRRFQAIKLANEKYGASIDVFKVIKEEMGANEETRVLDMLATNMGKPLTPIEQARAIKKLVDFGWPIKQIADKMGKNTQSVTNLLELNSATHELREAVQKNEISPSAAVELAKQNPNVQKTFLAQTDGSGKKVKVADVHKAVKGKTYTVSTKAIRTALDIVISKIEKNPTDKLEGMKLGMRVALGEITLETAIKSKS